MEKEEKVKTICLDYKDKDIKKKKKCTKGSLKIKMHL